ncbi:PAQR family membrane homeostasis protein TrhA [Pelagivirga sediminicola]
MSYPPYSRAERIADGAVHIAGVALGIAAVIWLLGRGAGSAGWGIWSALAIYCATLLAMLCASGLYHLLADTIARPVLRRLDHAAIYFKIAGTFTPLAVLLGTAFGYLLLGLVWGLALLGAAAKLMARRGRMTTGYWPYLALGWLGVALFIPLLPHLSWMSLNLILAGGLLYTAGLSFYTWEKLRFANAIWHVFVMLASGCFFAGIAGAVYATA